MLCKQTRTVVIIKKKKVSVYYRSRKGNFGPLGYGLANRGSPICQKLPEDLS